VEGLIVVTMQEITVAYDDKETRCKLGNALLLEDALSDLPPVCLSAYLFLKCIS